MYSSNTQVARGRPVYDSDVSYKPGDEFLFFDVSLIGYSMWKLHSQHCAELKCLDRADFNEISDLYGVTKVKQGFKNILTFACKLCSFEFKLGNTILEEESKVPMLNLQVRAAAMMNAVNPR